MRAEKAVEEACEGGRREREKGDWEEHYRGRGVDASVKTVGYGGLKAEDAEGRKW